MSSCMCCFNVNDENCVLCSRGDVACDSYHHSKYNFYWDLNGHITSLDLHANLHELDYSRNFSSNSKSSYVAQSLRFICKVWMQLFPSSTHSTWWLNTLSAFQFWIKLQFGAYVLRFLGFSLGIIWLLCWCVAYRMRLRFKWLKY